MKKIALLIVCFTIFIGKTFATAGTSEKDWTFLLFLNGNNNLDSYGAMNINQMEKVGSTSKINLVVQWASLGTKKTSRLLVEKDSDVNKVTSPILEDVTGVDMGDVKSLKNFVHWGMQKFPAKHYFVAVWDHGNGWHKVDGIKTNDISWDDNTGNHITTEELGKAMHEVAAELGRKIDIYGSDACLMSMAEVSAEMIGAVDYFVGSQEVEPGAGWPYTEFVARWAARDYASPRDVSTILTEEYTKSYQGGSNGTNDVTFSAFDMSKTDALHAAIKKLGSEITRLPLETRKKIFEVASRVQNFTYSDYGDLVDFLDQMNAAKIEMPSKSTLLELRTAASEYAFVNRVTSGYSRAHGVSIWLPNDSYDYKEYIERYRSLKFDADTQWSLALDSLVSTKPQ